MVQTTLSSLPNFLYHGTSANNLTEIEKKGISSPSYWTHDLELAKQYASSFGEGVVIVCEAQNNTFKANMQVAQCLFEDGDIDKLPADDDLIYSLEYLEGIVCFDVIRNYDLIHHLNDIQQRPKF